MKYIVFILISLSPFVMSAQKMVSLDEAIAMAQKSNARLKVVDSQMAQVRATKGENWEIAPTSASFSWGQINGDNKHDKQLNVEQGLGSLLTPYYKNALLKSRLNTGTFKRDIVEREVKAEVKRAWAYYQYTYNICSLYRNQEKLADEMQRIGDLRYNQGDITLLEKKMMNTVAAEMRNKRFQSEEELVLAAKRFQWCCYSEDPIVPADTTLMLFPVTIDQSMPAGSYSDYYSGLVMEKKAEMNIEKSRFFPTFSIGYNWQNILPMKNLNSWMVGVAFPLYFGPQKSRMRQAKIAMQTAQIEANEGMLQINHKLSELRASLSRLGESLNYYNNSALKEATELIKTADIQLRASETNVSDYIQSLNAAREIQRGYIDVVYQYNVAALEYELYKN